MSFSVRFCLCRALISPMEMEHHGHQVWKLDLGNPSWCLGHYYSAWARSWAFKCIRALCIDLTGCSVLADLSNYLSFVQLTWYCWSTFLALGAAGSSWGICGLGLVLRMGSWHWLHWVSVCLVSFKCFMFATGVTFFHVAGSNVSIWQFSEPLSEAMFGAAKRVLVCYCIWAL